MNNNQDIEQMSFEQAMAELEKIVQEMEMGKTKLEDAVQLYERGSRLQMHCKQRLRGAQVRLENITFDTNGAVVSTEFQ